VTTPVTDDQRCSVVSARLDEPMPGTAPLARAWLVLEQPGPFGRVALTESHLPAAVGAAVAAAAEGTRTSVLLARTTGRHADDGEVTTGRRFWFAHSSPGGVRMRSGVLQDSVLLRPDLPDLLREAGQGQLPPWGTKDHAHLLLLCTNSRRDRCCAIEGLPLAEGLARGPHADRVLEVNHLGGHRFAPTAMLLPSANVFGRLDLASATEVLDAALAGHLGAMPHLRGRSSAAAPAQAAAVAVRLAESVSGLDDIDVLVRAGEHVAPVPLSYVGESGVADLEVRHRDGRAWTVLVRRVAGALPDRSESCGKAAVAVASWVADIPVPAQPWA
jgi:hypothetical protein